jgi:phosphatidylinositol-3-phosphatase
MSTQHLSLQCFARQRLMATSADKLGVVNPLQKGLFLTLAILVLLVTMPVGAHAQMSQVKTVWVILMENHNWTGNNSGAAFGDPDIKNSPLAPYINGTLLQTAAHAEQYFNPPGNHPSQPNYLWLEAGTNFGVLADTQPGQPQLPTEQHLVKLLEDAKISWRAYAEPDFGNPVFDKCPLDFSDLDVEHLPFVYFNDVNDGLNPESANCIAHVRPYYQLATDLADHTSARYNFIIPNVCHDGHEGVSPCSANEPTDNTLRGDTWLKQNVPLITESAEYKEGGALFIVWDEAEDSGKKFSDGPIGMFLLSPFAKGGGKREYSNQIHYDHSSTLKTLQEIFHVEPLLGAAADPETKDLSDLFRGDHDQDHEEN